MIDDLPTAPIARILIMNGVRTANVRPGRGLWHCHGLGSVGEPLAPYLGTRASHGYAITLPDDRRDLEIFEVDFRAQPLASGRYPKRRATWEALGATDMPTLPLFADSASTA